MKKLIGYEIKNLNNMIERKIINVHKPLKSECIITPIQVKIIEYIMENNGNTVYQRDLEKNLNLRRSTISGILQTMEKNNIIIRVNSKVDARSKEIKLTDRCLSKVNFLKGKTIDFENKIKCGISNKELDVFFSVIDKIKNNVENL